jgi:Peptidase family M1 domain
LLICLVAAVRQAALSDSGQGTPPTHPDATQTSPDNATAPPKTAEALYLQLRSVGLDKTRVYHVRQASLNRSAIHITLDDGTIAFTQDVEGRVTGAFFQGEGEVLLMPPNPVERASMALFTKAAILEERFGTGYFRFNDDTYEELRPSLTPAENANEFVADWDETARTLASADALRILLTFSHFLPIAGRTPAEADRTAMSDDRMLHAHVEGRSLGGFDLYFDSMGIEQVRVGQLRTVEGHSYYDVWSSFAAKARQGRSGDAGLAVGEEGEPDEIHISSYKIRATVKPPTELDADAFLQMEALQGGERAVVFELSRFLQLQKVEVDGRPTQFIHNPALEGTQLARQGNDVVVVVFPRPLQTGQKVELRFVYQGEVLSAAGNGLLYVGARGHWYPNRGPAMSNFDLEFRYPTGWTLVATGRRQDASSASDEAAGEQVSRWVSERPMPLAGFNLGKYTRAVAHAGKVLIQTYAASGVETSFPQPPPKIVTPPLPPVAGIPQAPVVITPPSPSPRQNEQRVSDDAARAVEFFSRLYGPYPYGDLALTQMPGGLSQGWPGLIFLSSFAFLSPQEAAQLHLNPRDSLRSSGMIAHETAHQWWGDAVTWEGYRDQWLVEALAEYSSLMLLESQDPAKFREILEGYRDELLEKNKDGEPLRDAGPVTLGIRLSSSHFPNGYDAISYGRGAWLLHMLRTMLRDADSSSAVHRTRAQGLSDELFIRALRRAQERYQGKTMSTRQLIQLFEEELPRSLWYEGRKSLDWFMEGWVKGTSIPRLQLKNVKYLDRGNSTTVSGTIAQSDAPDDLVTSVPVYGTVEGRSVLLGRVFADSPETGFQLRAPARTRKIVLDPEKTLLARVR